MNVVLDALSLIDGRSSNYCSRPRLFCRSAGCKLSYFGTPIGSADCPTGAIESQDLIYLPVYSRILPMARTDSTPRPANPWELLGCSASQRSNRATGRAGVFCGQ